MKILLVNNTKSFYNAVNQSLIDLKMKIIVSKSMESVLDEIKNDKIGIIIINSVNLDWDLNSLLKRIKRVKKSHYISVISVISKEQVKDLKDNIGAGLDDFIIKPFSKDEFLAKIKIQKNYIKTNGELKKYKKKFVKYSKEDPITGLLNRRAFLDESLKEMGRSARKMDFVASIMIGIKDFKDMVDEHGGVVMNALLGEFGQILQASCRPYDRLGRYSISEFILILPDTDTNCATFVAERILDKVRGKDIKVNGIDFSLTVSLGISELDPDNTSKNNNANDLLMNDLLLDSLIRRSELAMEKAHEDGGNHAEVYSF